jgi:superoxide dismutase, Cu-Zn family
MVNKTAPYLAALAAFGAASAFAQTRVEMNLVDIKGVGAPVGTIEFAPAPGGKGVLITPKLKGLPPGPHGFHVHEFANCGAKEKDGKMSAAEMAGDHYDPEKTKSHAGATGNGHLGDLPLLTVDAKGNASQAMIAPRLSMKDLTRRAVVIHESGDNQSDRPKPNGGGGARIACGVIAAK